MSSHEGGQGRGGVGHTARSLLPTPVNSRPPRLHMAEPLPRRIDTTTHQNTTQHSNNHSTNNLNTQPTYNHTKNTTFRIQLRKINPNITTDKQKIFETTFKDLDVPLTKLSENNSGYYAITDEAAAVDKLTSSKPTKLFKKINLRPIIPPDIRAKRTLFIRQLDSSVGKLTPEEIAREIKTQQPWAKILEVTKIKNYTHVIKVTFSEISITQKILQNGLLMFNTKITPSQIELEKYTYIQICYKCYKFEDHATYQCTSTTPSCTPKRAVVGAFSPGALALGHRKIIIRQKEETEQRQKQEQTHSTYAEIAKHAIQQTNPPQHTLTLTNQTHIKLTALIIEAHIAALDKTKKFGDILTQSLKLNFNIDTTFPDRDSTDIFNFYYDRTDSQQPETTQTAPQEEQTIEQTIDTEMDEIDTAAYTEIRQKRRISDEMDD
ncbi:hypothetical protein FHG87_017586 [Trinorchestia longiramus]|nr:hypothetical protein FHG87_017586 [Trinorchestia longiramus]